MSKQLNYVMLFHHVLDAPAWRKTSHGARLLYISLRRQWIPPRKNLVYLPERRAAKELGSNRSYVRRWFRELIYYGFIVMERPAYLGVSGKGKAARYRLTECETFAPKGSLAPTLQATRDFDRWNGIPFKETEGYKMPSMTPKKYRPKVALPQSISAESRTTNCTHPGPQTAPTGGPQTAPTPTRKWTTNWCHTEQQSGPQTGAISINHLGRAGRDLSEREATTAPKLPWATPHLIEITDPEELRRIRDDDEALLTDGDLTYG
jgi:hypothetical protein